MAIQARTEFAAALNQVSAEHGITAEIVLESIKVAILAAYKKDYGEVEAENINVDINSATGEVKMLKNGKDTTPAGFGRIAAQTAKQVIIQRIREAEKQSILSEFAQKIGTIVSAIVLRISGPLVIINLGKTEGILPPVEQIPGETYTSGQRLKFLIKDIKTGQKNEEIVLSRSDPRLVVKLFEMEVPEVGARTVEIKTIAREPGKRTKIAVFSDKPGVDPVGSCVGQKGVRVNAVNSEVGSEKIDVIAYSPEIEQFIISALQPATGIKVKYDKKQNTAKVKLPADQLSLAIGAGGVNVRLAARLTGVKIDIAEGDKKAGEDKERTKTE